MSRTDGSAPTLVDVGRLARGADVLPGEKSRAGHTPEALGSAEGELASASARWAALSAGRHLGAGLDAPGTADPERWPVASLELTVER